MTSTSTKMMALLDENKETLSSDLYLKMSNLLLEKNKTEKNKTEKKYKITYLHTFFEAGGELDRPDGYDQGSDGDEDNDNPNGNAYSQYNTINTKTVYVKIVSQVVHGLKPECGIQFRNEDGCEYITRLEHESTKKIYRVGEYRHYIELYYKEYTLLDMKEVK